MTWTTPAELRSQVQKWYDRGILLAALAENGEEFPRRLNLRGPTSRDLGERFGEVRDWIANLQEGAKFYRIEWRRIRHRVLGANSVPAEVWVDSLEDALAMIGRRRQAERFSDLLATTAERLPELRPWLAKRPLRALELADDWMLLIDIVIWLRHHPRPAIYLRQVDLPGVDSKFIERHRGVLAELFDLVLPSAAVGADAGGVSGFCRRYGFRDKPVRVRLRLLDPDLALFPTATDQDITITADTFVALETAATRVFITENEINFLAFPPVRQGMVLFGSGYGFETLAGAAWLQKRELLYWGDIDTHGFAILDQFRAYFPNARSFLMDRETLLAHRLCWGAEPQPETRDLKRLTEEEQALYDDLRADRLGCRLRLEQEKIGFSWLQRALADLP